ncbi:hypothetical protein [Mycobacterium sp. URHB0021]|jgi:hypothetical protein
MTDTDERQTIADLAEAGGWQRREIERTDYYAKGGVRVQVLWQGTAVISGGSLYYDDVLTTTTRELATVQGWLRR